MSIEARRHTPRVKLNQTAYISFGSGAQGMVVDVSEKGLGFRTESAHLCEGPVRFWLTSDTEHEGQAELAWTDESRTAGGLCFTNVSPEIGSQIRSWMEGGPSAYPAIEGRTGPGGFSAQVPAVPLESEEATTEETGEEPVIPLGRLGEKGSRLSMFPSEATATGGFAYTASAKSGAHRVAVALIVFLFAAGGVAGALSYLHPREAREEMSRIEESFNKFINLPRGQGLATAERAGIGDTQPALESAAPPAAPDVTGTNGATPPPPVPAQGKDSAQETTPAQQDAQGPVSPNPAAVTGADTNGNAKPGRNNSQTELTLAQTYLGGTSTPERNAKGVELLWLATEKGNVDAEMQLADLYTRGVAVPKSCVQARILLKAAAAANPGAAKEKLDQLDRTDCK